MTEQSQLLDKVALLNARNCDLLNLLSGLITNDNNPTLVQREQHTSLTEAILDSAKQIQTLLDQLFNIKGGE